VATHGSPRAWVRYDLDATVTNGYLHIMNPAMYRSRSLEAALAIAIERGWSAVTRDGVAARCELSTGMISKLWGSAEKLRDMVMVLAVKREILPLIAQGLAVRHPATRDATDELKRAALASLLVAD